MKQDYPRCGIGMLCGLFGKTRHAYYDTLWRRETGLIEEDIILQEVQRLRKSLPRVGTRKLLHLLGPVLVSHQIRIGRDALFDLLQRHRLLVRQRRRKAITTDSRHWMRKYGNLIKDIVINRPEQVWVSDITYIRMSNQWGYLSLITDAYSRKIMGYSFRSDLQAEGCVQALQMALDNRAYNATITHHSDRGSQYCSALYVSLLQQNNIRISMTENGDPYENAIAERVNGIIKTEFNLHTSSLGFEQTGNQIAKSIKAYNELRPHASCNYLTPEEAHLNLKPLTKRWKNYHTQNKSKSQCIADLGL
ncbi:MULTISPECIES: IS3 family transposase [unclassified Flavobacterium]|uniref:IS3 family transposase n=1 Tax=unclassified Flavobacterium TaxID=196869 RepID=UPI001F13CD3F|nr:MULTISPECIES: IS3 family transposase [unclassified Flavobacterium]UMY64588.1 IS3 family transposase [Flavobacterium sp. HJ-32-4]UMY64628.1 IS3 family transposase [Flavobacterium sp. HJ-32-4]